MQNAFKEAPDHTFTVGVAHSMATRIRLTDDQNRHSTFYFDNGASKERRVIQAVAYQFALIPVNHAISSSITATLVSLPLIFLGAACATSTGPGAVKRKLHSYSRFESQIDFPVTKSEYQELRKELSDMARQKKNGVYSLLFNNCTGFAINFARKHGFDVPKPFWPTPNNLKKKIESAKNADAAFEYA